MENPRQITLRPMTRALCQALYAHWENDPAIYQDEGRMQPFRYDPAWVDRYYQTKTGDPCRAFFAVLLDGDVIGEIHLKRIDRANRTCALGIHLQNDAVKGRGYGTRAEKLALKYAFEELGMRAVEADALLKNTRSQRVLEKAGFRYVRSDEAFRYYRCERTEFYGKKESGMNLNQHIKLSPRVEAALREGRPVIALESTIISHGMPYPQNVETALKCEAAARECGAEPATIAVIGGKLCAGLTEAEIDYLGREGTRVTKASRRDLPILVAKGADGATTVAATMIIAALAGIRVFATGGIGGVHRGAETTMDISADLEELARTPVAVVCAGAKSILDLGLTLEYLETKGVPVLGYQTKELPAFYTPHSGFSVNYRADSPTEIASFIRAQREMDYPGGMLITNPIPEEFAMPADEINAAISQALREADEQRVKGKAITPFLLARVCELTGGESLAANIQLVLNNVRLAARIAAALG